MLDHTATTGEASMLVCCCALALAAMKFVTKMKSNKLLITMPTIAGARMPFLPCLEIPNKAMTPKIKPTTIIKSAIKSKTTGELTCLPNMRRRKTIMGHTQLNLAA